MKPLSPTLKKWLFLPPIVIGVGLVLWLALGGKGPKRKPVQERARVLRVLRVPEVDVVPRVLGYGSAAPARVWRAVAEVKGRLLKIHADLNTGAIVKKGEEVVRIDATEYELAIAQIEANKEQVEGQLQELAAQENNYRASLAIERKSLDLAEQALARSRELLGQETSSQSQVDKDQRDALLQKKSVQTIENSLRLIPAQRKTLQASLKVHAANLADARLDVHKAVMVAPFDCRLAAVDVEEGQFVAVGEVLFEAHGLDTTEVEAKMEMGQLRNLLDPGTRDQIGPGVAMQKLRTVFAVDVEVSMQMGDRLVRWEARFDRLRELIDPKTRTLGVVVAVDRPYDHAIPGKRPPLVKGMFCAVELRGKPRKARLVIPRAALRGRHVFVVGDDKRLRRREVSVDFAQSDFLCLASGLQKGDIVVVSDPTPAIYTDEKAGTKGTLVQPEFDEDLARRLVAQAKGEVDMR